MNDKNVKAISKKEHSEKSLENRKVYLQMMEDLKRKKVDCILTLEPDRISRSKCDFEYLVNEVEKYGCRLKFFEGKMIGAYKIMATRLKKLLYSLKRKKVM